MKNFFKKSIVIILIQLIVCTQSIYGLALNTSLRVPKKIELKTLSYENQVSHFSRFNIGNDALRKMIKLFIIALLIEKVNAHDMDGLGEALSCLLCLSCLPCMIFEYLKKNDVSLDELCMCMGCVLLVLASPVWIPVFILLSPCLCLYSYNTNNEIRRIANNRNNMNNMHNERRTAVRNMNEIGRLAFTVEKEIGINEKTKTQLVNVLQNLFISFLEKYYKKLGSARSIELDSESYNMLFKNCFKDVKLTEIQYLIKSFTELMVNVKKHFKSPLFFDNFFHLLFLFFEENQQFKNQKQFDGQYITKLKTVFLFFKKTFLSKDTAKEFNLIIKAIKQLAPKFKKDFNKYKNEGEKEITINNIDLIVSNHINAIELLVDKIMNLINKKIGNYEESLISYLDSGNMNINYAVKMLLLVKTSNNNSKNSILIKKIQNILTKKLKYISSGNISEKINLKIEYNFLIYLLSGEEKYLKEIDYEITQYLFDSITYSDSNEYEGKIIAKKIREIVEQDLSSMNKIEHPDFKKNMAEIIYSMIKLFKDDSDAILEKLIISPEKEGKSFQKKWFPFIFDIVKKEMKEEEAFIESVFFKKILEKLSSDIKNISKEDLIKLLKNMDEKSKQYFYFKKMYAMGKNDKGKNNLIENIEKLKNSPQMIIDTVFLGEEDKAILFIKEFDVVLSAA